MSLTEPAKITEGYETISQYGIGMDEKEKTRLLAFSLTSHTHIQSHPGD